MLRPLVLSAVLLCSSLPASAARFLEWYCGEFSINCSPNPNAPIQLNIDTSVNPNTYDANGLDVESSILSDPEQPRFNDKYSFAFNTGTGMFALVINLTYQNDNKGSTAENIQSTKLTKVSTAKLADGLIQITGETLYGKGSLPKDFSDYLQTDTGTGYFTVDYDPGEDAKGRKNVIYNVDLVIYPVPEPTTSLLVASAILLGIRLRKQARL